MVGNAGFCGVAPGRPQDRFLEFFCHVCPSFRYGRPEPSIFVPGRSIGANHGGSSLGTECFWGNWWAVTDSNRRHPACKAGALPAELTALAQRFSKIRGPGKGTKSVPNLRRIVPCRRAIRGLVSAQRNRRSGSDMPGPAPNPRKGLGVNLNLHLLCRSQVHRAGRRPPRPDSG